MFSNLACPHAAPVNHLQLLRSLAQHACSVSLTITSISLREYHPIFSVVICQSILVRLKENRRILVRNIACVVGTAFKQLIYKGRDTKLMAATAVGVQYMDVRFTTAAFTSISLCKPDLGLYYSRRKLRYDCHTLLPPVFSAPRRNVSLTTPVFVYTFSITLPIRCSTLSVQMFLQWGRQERPSGELRRYCITSHRGRAGRSQGRGKGNGNRGVGKIEKSWPLTRSPCLNAYPSKASTFVAIFSGCVLLRENRAVSNACPSLYSLSSLYWCFYFRPIGPPWMLKKFSFLP